MDQPSPYERLVLTWADRDDRWARMDRPHDDAAIEAARAVRMNEVDFLPPSDRARAWARVKAWYPPEHGQGGIE